MFKQIIAALLLCTVSYTAPAIVKSLGDGALSACESLPAGTVCANTGSTAGAPSAAAVGSQLLINVKTLGAKEDNATDDSAALFAAVAQVNAYAALPSPVYACAYIPAGVMYINGGAATQFFATGTPGGICGDGSGKSIIRLGPGFSGDLFAWSEAWTQFGGTNISLVTPTAPTVRGIMILGYKDNSVWPASTVIQNAFNFYDEDEWINFDDVTTVFVSGYSFRCGVLKNDSAAFCREGTVNNLRIFKGGNTLTPAPNVLLYTDCNSGCTSSGIDSTNQMKFPGLRDYAPQGTAVKIANNRAGGPIRKIHFPYGSVEGDPADQTGGTRAGNLFQIGDATLLGTETEIDGDMTFVSPFTGYYAFQVTGTASLVPFGIDFSRSIIEHGAGGGGGVSILSGKQIRFQAGVWNTSAIDLSIGPSSGGVAYPITIDHSGQESSLNASIDATSLGFVQNPIFNSVFAIPSFQILGTRSAAAWTTNGVGLVGTAVTYTDTSSSGTIANDYVYSWPTPTLNSTNAVTLTNLYAMHIPLPAVAGNTSMSGTGLQDSLLLDGGMLAVGLIKGTGGMNIAGAAINFQLNSNNSTTINGGTSTGAVSVANSLSTTSVNGPLRLNNPLTFATLPSCAAGTKGQFGWITDGAAVPVYSANAAGSGSVVQLVFCNGTNWTNH